MKTVITPKRIIVTVIVFLFAYGAYSLFDINRKYELNGFSDKCIYKNYVDYVDNAYYYLDGKKRYKCLNVHIDNSDKISTARVLTDEEADEFIQNHLYSISENKELKIGEDLYVFLNKYGTELLIKEKGIERHLTCIPDSFLLDVDNMYYENGLLYALSRKNINWEKDVNCSLWAKGSYASEQRLIKQDAIMKIDIFNDKCEILYKTDNERERIVGYSENAIATVKGSVLTIRSIKDTSVHKKHFLGIRKYYSFEVCKNRLFVWDGKYKLTGSYEL